MKPETKQLVTLFLKKTGKAINRYNMIAGGDRVAVALSGGKDSLAMLHAVALRRAHLPVDYDVTAVHVEVESIDCGFDRDAAEKFCGELGLALHVVKAPLPAYDMGSMCAACALARRNALFRFCETRRCNRLAFGHNLDDAVETLMMNMAFASTISAISPALDIFSGRLKIIRPLILMRNSEIEDYIELIKTPVFADKCPYWKSNKREDVRKILKELEDSSPGAVRRMFNSMSNIKDEYM